MMSGPNSFPDERSAGRHEKFSIEFDPEQVERFAPDHENGPVVGFVYQKPDMVRLIILEHTLVSHPKLPPKPNGHPQEYLLDEPLQLIFTPEEWVAFYAGVKDGEFRDLYELDAMQMIRDSKDPEGHFFIFWPDGYRAFLDGIAANKYDLPEEQSAEILATMTQRRS